jgi:poly(beta-D-mannuronate) lyase
MKRLIAFAFLLFATTPLFAKTIVVKNSEELKKANATALPGDTVILQNGEWKNLLIRLDGQGSPEANIVYRAQTAGKVLITGMSDLRIGGSYIVVDGLYFINGYSPSGPVIEFKINSEKLANHCRVTNTAINDFNKPKRMSEDYWVAFSGKNNRLDHCSFVNKKNMGVLLAVLLDDDRSRENFHSIDHNYFGLRPALGSNGGEIIRIGVSQHCQFNSNTQVKDNFFEHCNGETEIISVKSGANVVSNNIFKECQGSVVLRHGDNNTVTNNLFLGNGQVATGGVRVINKGQWVINNLFYKCRGQSFRSPLAIMNGIPNSPANRYVQVTDAVIMNNTFIDCAPMSFCEGSDQERTLPPANVLFANNIFYNKTDSLLFRAWDDISGFRFTGNKVAVSTKKILPEGFGKSNFNFIKINGINLPYLQNSIAAEFDSLDKIDRKRLPAIAATGFGDGRLFKDLMESQKKAGASWFKRSEPPQVVGKYSCKNAEELYSVLNKPGAKKITLTGVDYNFTQPLLIDHSVELTAKNLVVFRNTSYSGDLFILKNKSSLYVHDVKMLGTALKLSSLFASDTSGSSEHYQLRVENSSFKKMKGVDNIFQAYKSAIADSVIIRNSEFSELNNFLMMDKEKDDKGYYSAEKIVVAKNKFKNGNGYLLNIYRGGNDESTLGPNLLVERNEVANYNNGINAVISLYGVQQTSIRNNIFNHSNPGSILISYTDVVRSSHKLTGNHISGSGRIEKNAFVEE